jgi:hypothetical protein
MRFDSNVVPLGRHEVTPEIAAENWTWFLLHFYDEDADVLRVELSVPVEFVPRRTGKNPERGVVTKFDPRLILPPIPLGDNIEDEDEDEGDDGINIDVSRR